MVQKDCEAIVRAYPGLRENVGARENFHRGALVQDELRTDRAGDLQGVVAPDMG